MTTQPERIPLDDLTSDALDALYDRLERAQRSATLHTEAHRTATRRADTLAAEVARLTAGQCTHALAICEQHHTTPVAGCPYPRCVAARATGRAATA
ncbi:hypothetical protein [Streptomyces cyaneofuscatus]|uniref:hypothetical protein n=1 Tax=Streptomyces cyaneofuscatus TaxID=66883 RepID=UPI0033310AC0